MKVNDRFKSLQVAGLVLRVLFIAPNRTALMGEVKQPDGRVTYDVFDPKFLSERHWETLVDDCDTCHGTGEVTLYPKAQIDFDNPQKPIVIRCGDCEHLTSVYDGQIHEARRRQALQAMADAFRLMGEVFTMDEFDKLVTDAGQDDADPTIGFKEMSEHFAQLVVYRK